MKKSFVSLFSSYISDPHLALEQGRNQVEVPLSESQEVRVPPSESQEVPHSEIQEVPHSESQVEVPHSESQKLLLAKSLLEVLWLELVPM